MAVWLTSDWHLGHPKIAKLRGFMGSWDHDAEIIRNARKCAGLGDELWVLGDAALGDWRTTILLAQNIRAKVHYVLGNHDRPHPLNSNGFACLEEFAQLGGFYSVQLAAQLKYGGHTFLLSHWPYRGDSAGFPDTDRHPQWRLPDYGLPILHGHVHSDERLTRSRYGSSQIHVGVDAWDFKPVLLEDAAALLSS